MFVSRRSQTQPRDDPVACRRRARARESGVDDAPMLRYRSGEAVAERCRVTRRELNARISPRQASTQATWRVRRSHGSSSPLFSGSWQLIGSRRRSIYVEVLAHASRRRQEPEFEEKADRLRVPDERWRAVVASKAVDDSS